VKRGLPREAGSEPSGNARRVAGVGRRNGFEQGEDSKGWNPRSAGGMKQGRNGNGRNQSAERLRKPESAAQPGQVSPVQVASRFQSAEGERNLMRVGLDSPGSLRAERRNGAAQVGSNVTVGRKVKRGERIFCRRSSPGTCQETLKVHPKRRSTKRAC
jgi:hypothetical protein